MPTAQESRQQSRNESRFGCPHCGARYQIVRIDAENTAADHELVCLACGEPLEARQGQFALKYFLLERPRLSSRRGVVGNSAVQIR
jgi:transcription elongation factor Elf1